MSETTFQVPTVKSGPLKFLSRGLPQRFHHEASGLSRTTCEAGEEPTKPHMKRDEAKYFERLLVRAKTVLEYGCGGSTVLAAGLGNCHVFSVESDPAWLLKIEAQSGVRDATAVGRVSLNHVNLGPTGAWGFPLDEECRHLWPRYSELPWTKGSDYDLIFVDGRFRVACILHAALRASLDALIVVHDFWNRPRYHVVLPFLEWKGSCRTLAVFQRRRERDKLTAQALINEYQYISE